MVRQRASAFQDKSSVVNGDAVGENNTMNFFLSLFWLVCAVVLLAYEQFVGGERFSIPVGSYRFPGVWLMLALTLYNAVRWWLFRSHRAKQRAVEIARVHEEWERRRQIAAPAQPPEPNLRFTDEPPPK